MPPLTSPDIVDGSVKRGGSEAAIQHHYDVSNEFYALWLDPSLTYSCALWNDDNDLEGLDEAQRRKLDFHLAASGAPQARHILDVGCGWGSLLDRALGYQGIETATGLTLMTHNCSISVRAATHVLTRVKRAGLTTRRRKNITRSFRSEPWSTSPARVTVRGKRLACIASFLPNAGHGSGLAARCRCKRSLMALCAPRRTTLLSAPISFRIPNYRNRTNFWKQQAACSS